jgi:hypothetical protein
MPLMDLLGWLAEIHLGLLFAGLLVLLLLAKEIGYAIGRRTLARREARIAAGEAERRKEGVGMVTTGLLALVAFLLALAMSMAQSRHDARRDVVRQEANAIGTVWLRTDFAGDAAVTMRALLRDYAKVRLDSVTAPPGRGEFRRDYERTNDMQNRIWALASTAMRESRTPDTALLITALNEMIDVSLTSRRAFTDRVPIGVLRLLLWATLISIGAIGYNFALTGSRNTVFSVLLLVFWSSSLVLIVDMNNPVQGSIRVDPSPIAWTIQGFGPPAPLP